MDVLIANSLGLILSGGFVIGFLIGITGVGAGSLTTPLLISGVGVPPAVAVGTDLLFAAVTKMSAAWRHQRLANVDWPILGWLAAGSLPGAAAVLIWLYLAEPDTALVAAYVKKGLALTLLVSASAILAFPVLKRWQSHPSDDPLTETPVRRLATAIFGLILGAAVALTSVGAGAIGVAALTALYPHMLARRVVGTDIVHAVPLTFVAGVGHAGMGHIDVTLLAALLCGSIPGILIGSRLTGRLPDWALRIGLATVLCFAAYTLLTR
ncbi:MAG: sulfite exporter TauE/SafE family protein [Hyphomicrobium sp.]|mgnify:CR=1 FL=1|nr:sulfite exporter TauE/SafE family protein [Hyphomicrobium sp.]